MGHGEEGRTLHAVMVANRSLVHDINNSLSLLSFAIATLPPDLPEVEDLQSVLDRLVAETREFPVESHLPDAASEREAVLAAQTFLARLGGPRSFEIEVTGGERPTDVPLVLIEQVMLAIAALGAPPGARVVIDLDGSGAKARLA